MFIRMIFCSERVVRPPPIMYTTTDTCQNKVSAYQYHVTISRAQVYSSTRSSVFLKLTADQVLFFDWIAGSGLELIKVACFFEVDR